eukprot:gene2298-2517_t
MTEIQTFFSSLQGALARKNGLVLAKLLALPLRSTDRTGSAGRLFQRLNDLDILQTSSSVLGNDYAVFLPCISKAIQAAVDVMLNNFESAYRNENESYSALLDVYSNREENYTWLIPLLVRCSNDLRLVAEKVDEVSHDLNNKFLRDSLASLTKGFTVVAKDRTPLRQPGCKKLAIFAVTNVLFKIYFKVNTLQLCGKLISVIEGPSGIMENLQLFPVCDVVMYKYYLGRLKMFEDQYEEARDCLLFALTHTPLSQFKNRQRILASLIPVQMVLGVMPSERIGSVYQLQEFVALGKAVTQGDLRTFSALLETHQVSFVRIGVYLVLEHLRLLAYRSLFRRVYLITGTTRLNLSHFEVALHWLGQKDVDLDEIECLLCNLIAQGRVKGYISHEKKFLIVSKTDPFPKVCKKT